MKLIGTALMSALVVGGALGQGLQGQTHQDLWQPNRHIKDQQISLVPWGSGSIAETDETYNDGAFSLRISTHNYFQGGFVKLSNPVDMSAGYSDASNMLDFTFRTAESVVIGGGSINGPGVGKPGFGQGPGGGRIGGPGAGGGPGKLGGPGGGPPGGPPGGQGRGPGFPGGQGRGPGGVPGGIPGGPPGAGGAPGSFGPPGQGYGGQAPGAPGGPGRFGGPGAGSGTSEPETLKTVRVIIVTSDGKKSEAYLPLPAATENHPWREVAIPLQKINGFQNTNKVITGVGFSGDASSTYYVGDMRVVHDPTPINGEMNAKDPLNLALGDTVTLIGYGYGGATILKYSWSFDNTDGVKQDAVGQAVEHKFRKPGKFTVTLTIEDYYGLKQPFTVTVPVTVNP